MHTQWGSVNAISDITLAAGWRITTTCNSTSPNQVIQLVCEDNNPDCNHLFQGSGAVNTIVRLPENVRFFFINLPPELIIWTLSVARIHLRA